MVENTQPPYNILVVQNLTGSRNAGVQYTNNTGRTLFVDVSFLCETPTLADEAYASLFVNIIYFISAGIKYGIAGLKTLDELHLAVAPGITYQFGLVLSGTGAVNIIRWLESY